MQQYLGLKVIITLVSSEQVRGEVASIDLATNSLTITSACYVRNEGHVASTTPLKLVLRATDILALDFEQAPAPQAAAMAPASATPTMPLSSFNDPAILQTSHAPMSVPHKATSVPSLTKDVSRLSLLKNKTGSQTTVGTGPMHSQAACPPPAPLSSAWPPSPALSWSSQPAPPGIRSPPQPQHWIRLSASDVKKEEYDFQGTLHMFDKEKLRQEYAKAHGSSVNLTAEPEPQASHLVAEPEPELERLIEEENVAEEEPAWIGHAEQHALDCAPEGCEDGADSSLQSELEATPPAPSPFMVDWQQVRAFTLAQNQDTTQGRTLLPILGDAMHRNVIKVTSNRYGPNSVQMIERAAAAALAYLADAQPDLLSHHAAEDEDLTLPTVLIVAGRHRVGATAIAIGRLLVNRGFSVFVFLPKPAPGKAGDKDVKYIEFQKDLAALHGVRFIEGSEDLQLSKAALIKTKLIVDALMHDEASEGEANEGLPKSFVKHLAWLASALTGCRRVVSLHGISSELATALGSRSLLFLGPPSAHFLAAAKRNADCMAALTRATVVMLDVGLASKFLAKVPFVAGDDQATPPNASSSTSPSSLLPIQFWQSMYRTKSYEILLPM